MQTFIEATYESQADIDYGEGYIQFQWKDSVYGVEGLSIDLEGHCSRNMPLRSGDGPPEFIEITRTHVHLRFDESLAKRLELEKQVLINVKLSEEDMSELVTIASLLTEYKSTLNKEGDQGSP